jgi:hypothetical protein
MSDKFKGIPVENDTKIISQQETKPGEYAVLHQVWFWDGITAESIIFANEDVIDLSYKEIEMKVKTSPLLKPDSSITMKKNRSNKSGFTFVNFNFESE